jgi:hypothetical protein
VKCGKVASFLENIILKKNAMNYVALLYKKFAALVDVVIPT